MKKQNILIIGLGNIGNKRLKIILKNKCYNKIYLFDKIKINKKLKKTKVLTSFDLFEIKKLNIDLAILSVNPKFSYRYAKVLLNIGVNILVEKPPSFKFDQFKELYNLSLKKRKYLFVGFNFLYDPAVQLIKKELKNIGTLYKIDMSYLYGTTLTNINKVGAYMDVGLHLVSIIIYILGNFKIIHANFLNFEKKYKYYDEDGFILLKKGGSSITLRFSLINWINKFYFKAIGKKGMIELSGLSKWKNQELKVYKRVYPSGYPKILKKISFKKDVSFEREIKYILNKIYNRKFDSSENKKYMSIINQSFLIYKKQKKKINFFI